MKNFTFIESDPISFEVTFLVPAVPKIPDQLYQANTSLIY
jgi:hypothetical protein